MKPLFANFKDKFSKERISLGLDIGTQAVKIVKLRFLKDTVELYDFYLEPTQLDLGEILKKVKQSQEVEFVNIGVSGPATVIRYINFPRMNEDEFKKSLRFEAQKYIPFATTEVNLDGYILKEELSGDKMLVLIAAVKKEFIGQRIKSIQDAGLRVNIVDIDSLALVNVFNFNYSQDESQQKLKAIALLNIGSSMSNLDILENGSPRLSRDIHIAGNNFTQKLTDTFGIDFKAAEDLKINPDKERSNKVIATIELVLTNLVGEIRTSFDFYESQSTFSVGKIFLSGGGSLSSGLKDALVNLLGIEVEYWDPLKQISIAGNIDAGALHAVSSQLAVAVGLALRS